MHPHPQGDVRLGPDPSVHPTADVRDSSLGHYTEVLEDCLMLESTLGDYAYLSSGCDVAYADIGRFASVASNVRIGPTNHPMWRPSQHHFTYRSARYGFGPDDDAVFEWRRSQRTRVGCDVWIGHGAVVSKDVPPYAIVGGVPARMIRERFPAPVRQRLLRLAWWDWPHDYLNKALPDFRELDIEAFLDKYGGAAL
ncbi:Chloramphenicol acetyltransferase [Pseudodesulfovibrio hydrargyri]|uniref:Chloramphenicol acetyltransferase n=1 Tax=Pseudodesulfovibrio hydrargyri TaxID=2125990 RepID=A0A1J5NDT6_9BACT|nr:acetyltransferase [Pseudodesulfovibrio hydrargyri]OIQ49865.1 Chloramphenicol acetyltransferase [Pseudodesulfovibrio hydrargyri]